MSNPNALNVISDQVYDNLIAESTADLASIKPVLLPGFNTDSRFVRKAMSQIGLISDARRKSEIARVHTRDGSEQYDFPSRQENQSVMARVRITRSKEMTVGASVIARNSIRCTEIYQDMNPNAEGMWIRVAYADLTDGTREVFDRLEAFTNGDLNEGPWADMKKFSGVTEKDIKALREYLATHVRNCIAQGEVKILEGTSFIGWSDGFKKYSRPGFLDSGTRGLYADKASSSWTAAGDLPTQRKVLVDLFAESPRALMIAGFATAGLLLRPVGIGENYILAMVGADSSSLGKSTLMRVIKSFSANPKRLNTFDSTTKALKASTLYANDSCALIDEIGSGKLDQKERDALVYGLSAGVPRDSLVKESGEWVPRGEKEASRFTVVLSGEESLIDQSKAKKGVKIRYTQVAISTENRVWSFNDNERIETSMHDLEANHGHVFPAIVQMIQENEGFIDTLKQIYSGQLMEVRQRCGKSEKAKRKAHQVALAQLGVLVLEQVLDPNNERGEVFLAAVSAAQELLDDFIQEETSSDVLAVLLSLPTALAPFLAVQVDDGIMKKATIPNRMIGSAFHGSVRYQHTQVKNAKGDPVLSISDKPTPGGSTEIKGTVITLVRETAGPLIQEKLGIDLMMLVDESIRMGWAKIATYEKGFRKTAMAKYIIDTNARTRNSRGYEFIIPDDYEHADDQNSDDIG